MDYTEQITMARLSGMIGSLAWMAENTDPNPFFAKTLREIEAILDELAGIKNE